MRETEHLSIADFAENRKEVVGDSRRPKYRDLSASHRKSRDASVEMT
jgi:hypothetical protein